MTSTDGQPWNQPTLVKGSKVRAKRFEAGEPGKASLSSVQPKTTGRCMDVERVVTHMRRNAKGNAKSIGIWIQPSDGEPEIAVDSKFVAAVA